MSIILEKNLVTCRIVQVPVPVYVKKILLCKKEWIYYDVGNNPVLKTNHNRLVGKAVYNLITQLPLELDFPESLPMDKINIELNARVAAYYDRYGLWKVFELGIYYERVVQEMMMQHIAAQVRCKRSIAKAAADFFEMYEIDEDEYERRSAEQLWYKWRAQYPIK